MSAVFWCSTGLSALNSRTATGPPSTAMGAGKLLTRCTALLTTPGFYAVQLLLHGMPGASILLSHMAYRASTRLLLGQIRICGHFSWLSPFVSE